MTSPHFLVIGAYKSGTTALHHYLRAHPGLFVPKRREPSYFAFAGERPPFGHPAGRQSVRDLAAYRSLFEGAPQGARLGEVSPAYLTVPAACERIRRTVPKVRLVAVLRNPVERAYSDFLMYRRDGLEPESDFLRALEQQQARDPSSDPTAHYVSTGFYGAQLKPYLATFPRHQVHVLLHDDMRADSRSALRQVFTFLGVDPEIELAEQEPSNVSGEPANSLIRLGFAA